MRLEIITLNVPADGNTGPGTAQSVRDLRGKTLQFIGGVGSWDIEVSLDGTNFAPAIAGIEEAGVYLLEHACTHLRINATTNTTAPTVRLGGYVGD